MLMLTSIIFPLPPELLSLLLSLNLIAAVILLASALCISEPIKLSALPSMLLVLTLFRLALNVSTTRLILSEASAGSVIEAFGTVVIQGRLGVGIIVFLLMTLVQFLVIAKGAERVAEVAARFTLDALPGKQMAIDADLRSGIIDSTAARRRRDELQTESRFYGALDGAMKFVKGDAAAGLIITAVNFLGGVAAGVFGRGLDLAGAFNLYANLTIGDGLVCQIPSLMNAVSAGLVVTRVRRDERANLASDLWDQFSGGRSARLAGAIFALMAAAAPGFPPGLFISVGLTLLIMAAAAGKEEAETPRQVPQFAPEILPIIQVSGGLNLSDYDTQSAMIRARGEFFEETGILLPELVFRRSAAKPELRIRGERLASLDQTESWEALCEQITSGLRDSTLELIDDQMTQRLLDFHDQSFPEIITTVIPNLATVTQLTGIFRDLASERVSLRQLDVILQVVAERSAKAGDERLLLEEIRIGLKRSISAQLADKDNVIEAVRLPMEIDAHFAGAERGRHALDPEKADSLAKLAANGPKNLIIAASRAARRLLSEYLSAGGFEARVIAYEEASHPFKFKLMEVGFPAGGLRKAA